MWTLQIIEPEAMPENHQKGYGLENLTECSLDQVESAIKFLWRAEHGKRMKMELEMAKSPNFGGLSLISPHEMVIQN